MIDTTQIQKTLDQHGYEYKGIIGHGAFSSVILCHSKKYNHEFAIKRAIKHKLTLLEFDTLTSLHNSHIIKIYDSFEDQDVQYLVMEYCSKGTIKEKGCLSYDKFVYYARQILEAISYCHSNNIAHRDIKPDNIFLDEYDHVKIADFGMAKKFDCNAKSSEKCGSLMFMSPEMIQCQAVCPFKADIWALGVTFFYMATGFYPFQSGTREELKRMIYLGNFDYDSFDVDPQIRFLISKMTSRNIESRPSADKLLKYPMFFQEKRRRSYVMKDKGIGRFLPPTYYTQSTLGPEKIMKFDIDVKSDDVEAPKRTFSYREINFNPKVHRINSRLKPIKKF